MKRVVDETDGYTSAVAGARVEAIRTGRGSGPNVVTGVRSERLTVTSSNIGFPIVTHSCIDEGRVLAAFVTEVRCDSRWCGIPLRPGSVIVYGPGAEHTAINRPGLSFTFAITDLTGLECLAEDLQVHIESPDHAGVYEFRASGHTMALGHALHTFTAVATDQRPLDRAGDDVLRSMVSLLASSEGERRIDVRKGIDSREIVHSCIDYVEATDHIPSISELCLAAHVSERRMRDAFVEEFDQPPTKYFRAWALDEAHRRLRDATPDDSTVAEVAADLGFDHLGRFAGHYREMYGELPSATLHTLDPVAS